MSFQQTHCASTSAAHRYIHSIPDRRIQAVAERLKGLHAQAMDVDELVYDDLAHQMLVRDSRREADDLGVQNYTSRWVYDPLSGALKVVFEFGSEADALLMKLRVG